MSSKLASLYVNKLPPFQLALAMFFSILVAPFQTFDDRIDEKPEYTHYSNMI